MLGLAAAVHAAEQQSPAADTVAQAAAAGDAERLAVGDGVSFLDRPGVAVADSRASKVSASRCCIMAAGWPAGGRRQQPAAGGWRRRRWVGALRAVLLLLGRLVAVQKRCAAPRGERFTRGKTFRRCEWA